MGFLTEILVGEYGEVHNEQFFKNIIKNELVPMLNEKIDILEKNHQLDQDDANIMHEHIEQLVEVFPFGYVDAYPKHFFNTILEEMWKIEQKIDLQ